ncbi:MAG TPA: DUF1326 domain-containing protein [Candidatus Eisenbacteria bacterium]|nr:DUF1326 domain-containing protein [Candidatus Eisenbacteria bacterium]
MKTLLSAGVLVLALAGSALAASHNEKAAAAMPWSMNASIIEACSCPMFCQCYFATKPAAHATAAADGHDHGASEHYCRANNVFKVNKGMYGTTKLDGAKFWAAMDLGDDFSDGEMKWVVVTFDPAVTPAQREGIAKVLGALYPVKWQSFEVGSDLPIEWTHDGDRAVAKLDGGKAGEVVLNGGAVSRNAATPVVIKNLKYWGALRHDGFVLMPNEVEAYRIGPNAFEYKGTNGFMITFDINSKDVAPAGKSGM